MTEEKHTVTLMGGREEQLTESEIETREDIFACDDCNEYFHNDLCTTLENYGRTVCENCLEDYYRCSGCADYITEDDSQNTHGKHWCESCFNDRFRTCEGCGAIIDIDDCNYTDHDDGPYCCDCYEEDNHDMCELKDYADEILDIDQLKPEDSFNIWGVEIEAIAGEDNYNSNKFLKNFYIEEDGSLNSGGAEFITVPMTYDEGQKIIHEFYNGFAKDNLSVDTSCGLHIHIFMHEKLQTLKNMKKIITAYQILEDMFIKMNPPSRNDNHYCGRIEGYFNADKISKMRTMNDFWSDYYQMKIRNKRQVPRSKHFSKRYCWLNVNSIFYRDTIEIRLHSGTVNSKKIIYWYRIHRTLLHWIIDHSMKEVEELTVKKFLNEILDKRHMRYVCERIKRFSPIMNNSTPSEDWCRAVRDEDGYVTSEIPIMSSLGI